MKSVIRNGEYLFVEKKEFNDIEVPLKPHQDAIFQNGEWILDADKFIEETLSQEALEFLNATDWKVVRHRDQIDLNITPSLTNEEYITLLEYRQKAREEVLNNDITNKNLSTLDSRNEQTL